MHPAPSVILFTTFSGLGFGLLAWLGFGIPAVTGWVAFVFFAIAYALAIGGLVASAFHLGHPERAIKAFTQWRSSWLSREAWSSVAALLVMAVAGAGAVFFGAGRSAAGVVGAVLCLGTVFATSMIYTQLRSVPRWHHWLTPAMFLGFSLAGGALLAGQVTPAPWLLLLAGIVQVAHWRMGDTALARSGSSLATATGLGGLGRLRAFEPPHTSPNYLMREFIHVVGRKHRDRLRVIALGLGFALPAALVMLPFSHILAALAVVSHIIGVLASRWLFFAEAEHVVGLYYGAR
ncbi:dimethyl sulfoxide reductase anchor subunit family protein [Pukyongiella litopenaei]|uniref:Dibenzothiophene desulfurase n=1 Tax=Pukyongiella litopenaei TaxID=2605946 RepID=A0A2S0MT34_9RHOB|nr:DmsC/YnfH family molybdoenzyme membrane anchor subunit [Pukyongiella litopenaei]AVO38901.1 dibenzothiophene desulfurase [Pukyongiella litopenaei]